MLSLTESILNEFREEVPATRRVLERIPADKLAWKPHAKSRSLGELAWHVANIPAMAEKIIKADEFSPGGAPQTPVQSVDEHRATFEKNARTNDELLEPLNDYTAMGSSRLGF